MAVEVVERLGGARAGDDDITASALGITREQTRAKLAELVVRVHLHAGECLFLAGDVADALYVVETGRLRAFAHQGDEEVRVGEIGRGQLVGELALVDGQPRAASVYAVRDTVLHRLDRGTYEYLAALDPAVSRTVSAHALRRLREGVRRRYSRPSCFAFVPVSAQVQGLAERVARAVVAEWGPDARLVTGTAPVDVSALEEQHPQVAFVVDAGWTEQGRQAVRSADRVVLVADARMPAGPGAVEAELARVLGNTHAPDVHLLLVHPTSTSMPSGTRAWLDVRVLAGHLHLREGDQASTARVARLLAGTGNAVVFGGGGARGSAHLGVIEVLEELGRPIDLVGGASVGALVASGIGLQLSPAGRRQVGRDSFRRVLDYTLPVTSVLAGGRATRRMKDVFGDLDLADFWVPFFCVSTNLTRSRAEYHDRGPVVRALRASIAIPGVFPPVAIDGDLHVDGGVIDNVPAGEMRRRNPTGHVLAIDVAPGLGPTARADYGLAVRGHRAWIARRRGAGPPRLLTTLVRSTLVASVQARERAVAEGAADLYLDIDTAGGGMLDFKQGDSVADAAAQGARPVLSQALQDGGVVPVPRQPGPEVPEAGRPGRPGGVLLLTLRDLQLRAVRVFAAVVATSVVFALLFIMTGLVEQFDREPRATVDSLGASGWMVRDGATGAFSSSATIPQQRLREVKGASAVLIARQVITGETPLDIVIIGYTKGTEPRLLDGALPARPREVVLDESAGYEVGEQVTIGPVDYTVAGRTDGSTLFAGMPIVYFQLGDAQQLIYRGSRLVSALLVDDPSTPAPKGLQMLTPEEIALDARRPLENAISSIDLVRALLWFVAAMIIGTLVYLSALDRRRDVAVLKAVGGGNRQLGASIALQGVLVALGAIALATALQAVIVPVFPMDVSVPGRAYWQLPLIAVIVALVAGAAGLRQAVRTDPALAFSGPGQ